MRTRGQGGREVITLSCPEQSYRSFPNSLRMNLNLGAIGSDPISIVLCSYQTRSLNMFLLGKFVSDRLDFMTRTNNCHKGRSRCVGSDEFLHFATLTRDAFDVDGEHR